MIAALALALVSVAIVCALVGIRLWNGEKGELIAESVSPKGTWIVRAYYLNPGAMARAAVRAEVVGGNWRSREFYFEYTHVAEMEWESEEVIILNGRRLDVRTDSFP